MDITEAVALIFWNMEKYPLSEPQDVVKLLYQSEFGPAHAISNAEAALERLIREYRSVEQREAMLAEYIGNGFARIDLTALDHNGIAPETLAGWFVESASPAENKEGFAELLRALCREELPLDMAAFREYVESFIAAGCPAVHHSPAYNKAYSPAYRVVKAKLLAENKII